MDKYRHEIKFSINAFDKAVLSSRLSHALPRDKHAGGDGSYVVRSLYFDDCSDTAAHDKLMGVIYREKFRLRIYDGIFSVIRLEKKVKHNQGGYKENAFLSLEECQSILSNDYQFLKQRPEMVCRQFYSRLRTGLFTPKVIVQYNREAYTWEPGHVRITLDSNVQTGLKSIDFLNGSMPLTGAFEGNVSILEIKYNEFLPAHIGDLLLLDSRRSSALSKYILCRRFE